MRLFLLVCILLGLLSSAQASTRPFGSSRTVGKESQSLSFLNSKPTATKTTTTQYEEAVVMMMIGWSNNKQQDLKKRFFQEIAFGFEALVDENDYEDAADMLTDDFVWSAPMFTSKSKADWRKRFPRAHKLHPKNIIFGDCKLEEAINDDGDVRVSRKGKWKMAPFVSVTVRQSVTFDSSTGKIRSMVARVL